MVENSSESLVELAERVEKAEGADRGIDLVIARHMGVTVLKRNDEDTANYATTHWHYTASIDDAMSLVPEGYGWAIEMRDGGFDGVCWQPGVGGICWEVRSKSPALALVAAALRARSAALS